jgi:hypothetical protein
MMRAAAQVLALLALLAGSAAAADVPPLVATLAQDYIAAHPDARPYLEPTVAASYAREFLDGFLAPDGSRSGGPALSLDAYHAGQAYRNAHPQALNAILTGYGYVRVNKLGRWTDGFEVSLFEPEDARGGWWVGYLRRQPDRPPPGRVRMDGYLSPEGEYGHLGMFRHQVLAISITAP